MECNVSELVKRGHDKAAQLKSSGGAVSQLISDLATQLDVQLARSNALAAENAGLKNALEWLYEAVSMPDSGPIPDKYYSAITNAAAVMHETQATDDFLAELLASVVGEVCLKISNAIPNCYQDELVGLDAAATICGDFAAQIRKEHR